MSDLNCHYCGHEFDVCHDDGFGYEEGEAHHQECPECKKTFVFHTTVFLLYTERKADCLNGSEHSFKFRQSIPLKYSKMRCMTCGELRQATDDEIAAQVKP